VYAASFVVGLAHRGHYTQAAAGHTAVV
jgi:hypothetical protein